jgi:hypothetical protein
VVRDALSTYYDTYLDVAEEYDHPIARHGDMAANADFSELLKYPPTRSTRWNREAVAGASRRGGYTPPASSSAARSGCAATATSPVC